MKLIIDVDQYTYWQLPPFQNQRNDLIGSLLTDHFFEENLQNKGVK